MSDKFPLKFTVLKTIKKKEMLKAVMILFIFKHNISPVLILHVVPASLGFYLHPSSHRLQPMVTVTSCCAIVQVCKMFPDQTVSQEQ